MTLSFPGIAVCLALLTLGYFLRAPVIIALFASLPFGSTAIGELPGLGGSSPLIYAFFGLLFCASLMVKREFLRDLSCVFTSYWVAWIVGALVLHAVASAVILPRLFAGQTSVIVPTVNGMSEVPLSPVSGNITQAAYLTLSALMFFGFCVVLKTRRNITIVRRAYFTWVVVHALLGVVDLGSKLIGAGDVLLPIRTASYALLTEVEEAGFWRVAGGFAEASSFGGVTLSCLGFTFAYWRVTNSRPALGLTLLLFFLLIASTSSTAYAGGAVLALALMIGIACAALTGRIVSQDIILLGLGLVGLLVIAVLYLYHEKLFDPVLHLIETTLLDKASSESARERGYWNYRSLQSFIDSAGLGIGLGSSRASNWPIAVLSQLGVIGAVLMGCLVFAIVRGVGNYKAAQVDQECVALAAGARGAIFGSLVAGSMIGTSADPGLLFFIGLAIIVESRRQLAETADRRRVPSLYSPAFRRRGAFRVGTSE